MSRFPMPTVRSVLTKALITAAIAAAMLPAGPAFADHEAGHEPEFAYGISDPTTGGSLVQAVWYYGEDGHGQESYELNRQLCPTVDDAGQNVVYCTSRAE